MKYAWFFLVIICVSACKEPVKETAGVETDISEESEEAQQEYTNIVVPIYNYAQLNEAILSRENDTTYVVNFWATWCKPCIKELPAFEKLHAGYEDRGVKVVLVSLDFPDKLEKSVKPFLAKNGIESAVVLLDDADANSWIPAISEEWSGAIPATLIISKDQRKFYERSFTFEELETELKTVL